MTQNTRRGFLKTASLVAGGLAGAGVAGTALAQTQAEGPKNITWDAEYDVIVVGSGIAATVAATFAAKHGAKTLMLEKMAVPGGSSAISNATLAVAGSDLQEKEGLKDSWELFFNDMEKRSNGLNNPALHETIAKRSRDVYFFLKGEGATFEDTLMEDDRQSVDRVVSPKTNGEVGILLPLRTKFLNDYNGTLLTRAKADEIIFDDNGRAIGVKARVDYRFDHNLYSDDLENKSGVVKYFRAKNGIICGTGGFVNDKIMRAREFPKYKNLPSSQHMGATMGGMKLLQQAGAQIVHANLVQHSLPLGAEISSKGFMIDPRTGKRFINELGDDGFGIGLKSGSAISLPDLVAAFLEESGGLYPIAIFDEPVRAQHEDPAQFERNVGAGFAIKADTIEELAKKINIDPATLAATAKRYNSFFEKGVDEDFHKDFESIDAKPVTTGPFYAYYIFPFLNYCLGGAYINEKGQVIRQYTANEPILGLYAAGEATGGVHGAGRVAGTSIADGCVFGMVSAENALLG